MTVVDPLAQELPEEVDALTVTVPTATSVAKPGVPLVGKVSFEVSLDVQVALLVTLLLLLSVASNCCVPLARAAVVGVIVSVWELPPVVLPVIDPVTPAKVAVMVTLDAGPTAVTTPAVLTVAHAVELDQLTELVTTLLPLL